MEITIARLEKSGRLLVPAEWRARMNLKPGTEVILAFEEGHVVVLGSRADAIRRAQALVRKHIAPERSLSEELSQERQDEAARER